MTGLQLITAQGAFDATVATQINSNFAAVTQPDIWVRPQNGIGGTATGTYSNPFSSMALATGAIRSGMTVGIEGVLTEEYVTPLGVHNVSLIGWQVTPRQATTSGVPNGAGATWLSPSTVTNTAALIRVQGQGWTLANLYFNSTATSNGCIQPYTTGDPNTAADGAHLLVKNCILTGAAYGIYASGGTNFVSIDGCKLFGFSGSGDTAIAQTAGAGIGTLTGWSLLNSKIYGNANNITMPFSKARIQNNCIDSGTTSTINLTGGVASNYVVGNFFNIAAADFDPAGGVTGVSGDVWSNTLTDAIETGLPAN